MILSPEAVEVIRKAQQWHAELVDGSQPVHIFSTAPAGRTKMDGNNWPHGCVLSGAGIAQICPHGAATTAAARLQP
ncbi:hypothetical protein IE982_06470 [Enterobacter hormaechei]|uniref:Uncharacterized protein n=1 Tax=Enterobacter hormaechei TaxID=158836 RepID=A0A927DHB8_9ENTR|nr:hypothetical protein [Enterobacter hormaechei]MBD3706720.1 hypothetical protein [Enterobacter hormaechei]